MGDDNGQEIFPMGDEPDLLSEPIGTRDESPIAAAKPAAEAAPVGPWWKEHESKEIEYTANGKAVKEPFSKVLQRAQMGYNYAQQMGDFNRQKAEFEAKAKTFESDSEWKSIADYAKQDPDWAAHTKELWNQRETWRSANPQDPTLLELNRLKAELNEVKTPLQAWQKEQEAARIEKENQELDAEITSTKEKYSKLGMDFASVDPSTGLSVESTVIDYAVKNGIKSFKTAFLEVYGDRLESKREEALKSQWAKEQATKAKQGFIGRTPTPTQGRKVVENPGSRSWDDIGDEAKAAYKAGHY